MLVVFVLGLPALMWRVISKQKDLESKETLAKYRFLYEGFSVERGRQYWEVGMMLRAKKRPRK